jgi:hypothetical protein
MAGDDVAASFTYGSAMWVCGGGRPAAPSRRCRPGKGLTDNFISSHPHGTYTMTGNGAANLGCEPLERYPRVRRIASGTSNPWQSSRFAGNAAAITASLRRPLEKRRAEVAPWRNATRPIFDISAALTSSVKIANPSTHADADYIFFQFKDRISSTMSLTLNEET